MTRRLALDGLSDELASHEYPMTVDDVAVELQDFVLEHADGEARLPDLVDRSDADVFVAPDDLEGELRDLLPADAADEPGQSADDG